MGERWTEDRETAVHEAGHAVVAFMLGRPFTRITVAPGDLAKSNLGQVEHRPPTGTWYRPDIEVTTRVRGFIEQHVMICLAGAETSELWYQRIGDAPPDAEEHLSLGALHDMQCAVDLASYVADGEPGETGAFIEWLRLRLRNLVEARGPLYWALVDALADAVMERGSLSWRQARLVLEKAQADVLRGSVATHPVFARTVADHERVQRRAQTMESG
jgi:hypothetical protein